MPNRGLDPYMLAAVRGVIDPPAAQAMAKLAEEHVRLVDPAAMQALGNAAGNKARMFEASGIVDTMSAARGQLANLTGASKLTDMISALSLGKLQQPLLGDDLTRYVGVFKGVNAIDSALIGKFDALGTALRQAPDFNFTPYEQVREALGGHGALERLAMESFRGHLLSDASWSHIARDFDRLKDSYAGILLDPVSLGLPFVADLHLPEIDVAVHSNLIRAFEAEDDEVDAVAHDMPAEMAERTIRQVDAISPRLAAKLRSAFENLRSSDPQAASNACLAIRQILMALLRKLAPEDSVRPWAKMRNDPELFKHRDVSNETSYLARILYLSRFDLDERSAYSTFLVQNARSLVSVIKIVNTEIHDESAEKPPLILTAGRVEHLLLRAACAFGELIICANLQNKMSGR